jgi:hypothetical protein
MNKIIKNKNIILIALTFLMTGCGGQGDNFTDEILSMSEGKSDIVLGNLTDGDLVFQQKEGPQPDEPKDEFVLLAKENFEKSTRENSLEEISSLTTLFLDVKNKMHEAIQYPGRLVNITEGITYSTKLVKASEYNIIFQTQLLNENLYEPQSLSFSCAQSHEYTFTGKNAQRDYKRAFIQNSKYGHSFRAMIRHKHKFFLGQYKTDYQDLAGVFDIKGFFTYAHNLNKMTFYQIMPCSNMSAVSSVQANQTKLLNDYAEFAIIGGLWLSIRLGLPVLFSIFAPEWLLQGNAVAVCLATGMATALKLLFDGNEATEVFVLGTAACIMSGVATYYWKSIAMWGNKVYISIVNMSPNHGYVTRLRLDVRAIFSVMHGS